MKLDRPNWLRRSGSVKGGRSFLNARGTICVPVRYVLRHYCPTNCDTAAHVLRPTSTALQTLCQSSYVAAPQPGKLCTKCCGLPTNYLPNSLCVSALLHGPPGHDEGDDGTGADHSLEGTYGHHDSMSIMASGGGTVGWCTLKLALKAPSYSAYTKNHSVQCFQVLLQSSACAPRARWPPDLPAR